MHPSPATGRSVTSRTLRIASLCLAGVCWAPGPGFAQEVERVSAEVRAAVAELTPGETLPVIIEFEAPPVERAAGPGGETRSRLAARAALALRGLAQVAGPGEGEDPDLRIVERLWVAPVALAEVTPAGLERLAGAPGVRRIVSDEPLPVLLEPPRGAFAPPSYTSDAMRTIGADAVWDAGATGEGVVVAFFDSGVDAANAMVSSRWRGRRTSIRASWFDPFRRASEPMDGIGHGTQVAVAAVGALDAGDTLEFPDGSTIVAASDLDVVTGVAPRAEWIAARVFDNFGGGVFTRRSVLLQAFQWALDPDGNPSTDDAPDVINSSWGILPTGDFDLCTDVLYGAIDAAEAAGIAVLFAAGNAGPAAGSVAFPAARDDPTLRSFAVGASSGTTSVTVAEFSGRGPSPCGGGLKPEIIAPGTVPEVRGAGPGRARLTGFTVQGTSFSTAQVSGALALLRQARGGATPEALKRFLIDSAEDVGAAGPDDDAGFGLLDVPAALSDAGALLVAGLLQLSDVSADPEGLTVQLRNRGDAAWPGGGLRVEPASHDGRGWAATATLPAIEPGSTVAARLASDAAVPADRATLRVTVTDATGVPELSRLVVVVPADAFGGFVLEAGELAAGANDFGRLGRIAAQQGFAWQGTDLLTAGGIAVAAGGLVSDGLYAGTLGRFDLKAFGPAAETDWAPQRSFTDAGAATADVRFDDFEALTPVGLEVTGRYEASESGGVGALGVVLTVLNRSGAQLSDVVVGLLADWDLPGGETIRWVPGIEALVAEGSGAGTVALLAADTTVSAHVELPLGTPGTGGLYEVGSGVLADSLVEEVKLDLLRGGSAASLPGAGTAQDNAALLGVGPFSIAVGGTLTVRFWLLAADDEPAAAARLAELREQESPPPPAPGEAFAAEPPYPNPLRIGEGAARFPFTLSDDDLATGGDMSLEIYDLAGRRLFRDRRVLAPGGVPPEFTWDGRLGGGAEAAGGMYLYVIRLGDRAVSGRLLLHR